MRIRGTLDDFRAIMKRLYDLNDCGWWVSSNGDDLQFGECTEEDSPPGCATWEVFHWPRDPSGELAQGRHCYGAIEVYDYSNGYIDVEFLDGYRPKSGRWRPIGPLFGEFCEWVMIEFQRAIRGGLEIEVLFNGTPADFAAMVRQFDGGRSIYRVTALHPTKRGNRALKELIEGPSPPPIYLEEPEEIPSDVKMVYVEFGPSDDFRRPEKAKEELCSFFDYIVEGRITAIVAPDDQTLLQVDINDRWPELAELWESLHTELQRLGWVEPETPIQEAENGAGDSGQTSIDRLLMNKDVMRQYYRDYSPKTAREIVRKIPEAWDLCNEELGRWGPGFIARVYALNSTTIGRYLKAFRKAGITEVDGIEI